MKKTPGPFPYLLVVAGFAGGCAVGLYDSVRAGEVRHGLWLLALGRLLPAAAIGTAVGAGLGLAAVAVGRRRGRHAAWLPWHLPAAVPALACLVLLAGLAVAVQLLPGFRGRHRPNIVLIVLDTVRADRLSLYGYPHETTPEIDTFARRGIVFTRFYSTSSWTLPSHASLFTGLYPVAHGATQEHPLLQRGTATLAERLRERGYQTWAASRNPYVSGATQLDAGFETFLDLWRPQRSQRVLREGLPSLHPINAAFARFLVDADRDRPFFVFMNYMRAHSPYTPTSEAAKQFLPDGVDPDEALPLGLRPWHDHYVGDGFDPDELAILSGLYDAELRLLSHDVGELLQFLERDERFEDTLVAIVADHGEHFGENGLVGHVFTLYDTALHVPLVLRLPGDERAGSVDDRPGQLPDLFATLVHAAGLDTPASAHQGIDLLTGDPSRRAAVLGEEYLPVLTLRRFDPAVIEANDLGRFRRRMRVIQEGDLRFVWGSDGRYELYDRSVDPQEENNLWGTAAGARRGERLREDLRSLVARYRGAGPLAKDPEASASQADMPLRGLDEETREQLRMLGYGQ